MTAIIITIQPNNPNGQIDENKLKQLINALQRAWPPVREQNAIIYHQTKSNNYFIKIEPFSFDLKRTETTITNMMNHLGLSNDYKVVHAVYDNSQTNSSLPLTHQNLPTSHSVLPQVKLNNNNTDNNAVEFNETINELLKQYEIKDKPSIVTYGKLLRIVAAKGSATELEKLLSILNKIDPKIINSQGEGTRKTALHWAIEKKETEKVKKLIEYGASIRKADGNGMTPFDYVTIKPELRSFLPLLISKYPFSYEEFLTTFIVEEGIPSNIKNRIFHALNDGIIKSGLRKQKLEFVLKGGLTFEIKKDSTSENQTNTTAGGFQADRNKIYFFISEQKPSTLMRLITHEIEHAYKHHLHVKRLAKQPNVPHSVDIALFSHQNHWLSLPFFPCIKSEMHELKKCMTKGDERVLYDFYPLLLKERNKITLTEIERKNIDEYKLALKNYKPARTLNCIDDALINKWETQGVKINKETQFRVEVIGKNKMVIPIYIDEIKKIKNKFYGLGYYVQDIKNENERLLNFVHEIAYRNRSLPLTYNTKYKKLAEQHARTIGELPQEALEKFYPEVLEYDKKDKEAMANEEKIVTL